MLPEPHPLSFDLYRHVSIPEMAQLPARAPVALCARIDSMRIIGTRKGALMALLSLETDGRKCEAVVFPRTMQEYGALLMLGEKRVLRGTVDWTKGQPGILVNEVAAV